MKRIKYIKSKKFFVKEYKDGIIVAFKNIGDNSPSYADQIHQIVSKNFGVDLFVSDIVESISGTNSHKDSIKYSLFVYVKNDVSISACGISLCSNKDCIEVEYNSEDVLSIKIKQLNKFWIFILFVCILGYIGYNIIVNDDKTNDQNLIVEPDIGVQTGMSIEADKKDNNNKEQNNTNIKKQQNIKHYVKERLSPVEYKRKQDRDDVERECQRKTLKAEADEYVRIADQAYVEYADNFDESIGIVALVNYKKALDLNKKYGLFFISEREKIEQKINVLEKELK